MRFYYEWGTKQLRKSHEELCGDIKAVVVGKLGANFEPIDIEMRRQITPETGCRVAKMPWDSLSKKVGLINFIFPVCD